MHVCTQPGNDSREKAAPDTFCDMKQTSVATVYEIKEQFKINNTAEHFDNCDDY